MTTRDPIVPRFVAGLLLASCTAPLAAAPLCRDTKGLFTPCPPQTVARAKAEHVREVEQTRVKAEKRRTEGKPPKPPMLAKGRLCRDGKGLFTPCPG